MARHRGMHGNLDVKIDIALDMDMDWHLVRDVNGDGETHRVRDGDGELGPVLHLDGDMDGHRVRDGELEMDMEREMGAIIIS